jgi:CheY-like chemotaxis protein
MKTGSTKHTVLVVEDEDDLREMMREALELSGYAVVAAEDGQQALGLLSGIDYLCLVLIDLLMPGMNGWDLFDELRRRPELDAVPIVVYSSVSGRAPRGAPRVLQKPLTFGELHSTVREYCAPNAI